MGSYGSRFIRRNRSWKRGSLNLEKHPDKTFIGRIERGFDFLGYHFRPDRLSVAAKTIENFVARALRLYEQEPGEPLDSSRLGVYVKHWAAWAGGDGGGGTWSLALQLVSLVSSAPTFERTPSMACNIR